MIWLRSEHGRGSMEVHSKDLTVQSVVQGVDVTYKYIEGPEIKPWLSLLTRPSNFSTAIASVEIGVGFYSISGHILRSVNQHMLVDSHSMSENWYLQLHKPQTG